MLSEKDFAQLKYYRYVEKAPVWLAISVIAIVIGIAFMFVNKAQLGDYFKLSIHFTGGDKILLQFTEPVEVDAQKIAPIVKKYANGEPIVQVYADDPHIVSIKMNVAVTGATEDEQSDSRTENVREMKRELGNAYGGYSDATETLNPVTLEQDYVGPTVGKELVRNAFWALIIGCILIMVYILIRFGRWQMSLAGIVALVHDVLITLGFTAILRLEVNDSFIAVVLTIIGYSINDTIIVFDRVRENYRAYGDNVPFSQLCNLSVSQTIVRSINTVMTVIIMLVAMLVLGGANVRDFLLAMLVGMIAGGYSSIFIATPIMLWLSRGKMIAADAAKLTSSGGLDLMEVPAIEGDSQAARERARRAAEDDDAKLKVKKQQRRR